ncbi:MAG: GvpL/GvpF family gas vesicle protein [Actinobacteria bacterium]|nr:MAG: GvpL/GvpF family gas vesicle protein [Actinomycetota bacterium]
MSAPTDSETPEQQVSTGCYVYGIAPADLEATSDARGVGDPPGKVSIVRHDQIAALVSDIDLGGPLGTPEDLLAHQQLLDAAASEVPVLPMRFGAVMTDPEAVKEELLAPHHDEFLAALNELGGRVEYVVKGRYVEEAILSEVLSEVPTAQELRQQLIGQPEDATRNLRIQLGEIINQAITAKRDADTAKVVEALSQFAAATAVREPTHEQDAAHVVLLAELGRQGELEQALAELGREWEGRVNLRLLGPLAPYDFVVAEAAQQ